MIGRSALFAMLVGCASTEPSYGGAFIAETSSGPVLVMVERTFYSAFDLSWPQDVLVEVDLATGERGRTLDIGPVANCVPATVDRVWCSYISGPDRNRNAFVLVDVASFEIIATSLNIEEASDGLISAESLQQQELVVVGLDDGALGVFFNAKGLFANLWVDPVTLAVSSEERDVDAMAGRFLDNYGALTNEADLEDDVYAFTAHVLTRSTNGEAATPLNRSQSYEAASFVRADVFDPAAGALTDEASLFVVDARPQGFSLLRVATADGAVLWTHDEAAGELDVAGLAEGVLVVVVRTVDFNPDDYTAPMHAHTLGLSLEDGSVRWTSAL